MVTMHMRLRLLLNSCSPAMPTVMGAPSTPSGPRSWYLGRRQASEEVEADGEDEEEAAKEYDRHKKPSVTNAAMQQ